MSATLPVGPYKMVETGVGAAPWYIVPFDKNGRCTAPLTRQHLADGVSSGDFTDVFVFSHGWNNDWDVASKRYEDFISSFIRMRADFDLAAKPAYKPLLVGVFWPSTALVLPWERPPRFAADAGGESSVDREVGDWQSELAQIAEDVDPESREELYLLAQKHTLTEDEGLRLATILAKPVARYTALEQDFGGPITDSDAPSGEELLARSRQIRPPSERRRRAGEFGFARGVEGGPQAAFELGDLDPRNIVRVATVLQMKDRAGVVGRDGVGPLLRDLAVSESTRLHLVGHSYGAIVVLSALSAATPVTVESVLLLQPAVSQWCFAANVAGKGFAGGYRVALDRVRTPIFTTFTRRDEPLTKFFHLAVRRERDLGQPRSAGDELPAPPSLYAALGGFGPAGLEAKELQVIDMTTPPTRYGIRVDPRPRVCALRGDAVITGHGDISVPATWWALYQQVEPSMAVDQQAADAPVRSDAVSGVRVGTLGDAAPARG